MAEKILLPALSPTMEMGTIVAWLKGEGDSFKSLVGDGRPDLEQAELRGFGLHVHGKFDLDGASHRVSSDVQ